MSTYIAKENFSFWLKTVLATYIAKDALAGALTEEIENIHRSIIETVCKETACSSCSIQQVLQCRTYGACIVKGGHCDFHQNTAYRPCPNGICDKFKKEILRKHKHNKPSWRITKAEDWCSSPFQFAKCFLPPEGYLNARTLSELDPNGVLSIILNLKDLLDKYDENLCEKAREITRNFRHSSNLQFGEHEMHEDFDVLVKLLSCSKNQKIVDAKDEIIKLQSDHLEISSDYVTKVLHDVRKDMPEQPAKRDLEKTENALSEIHKTVESIAKMLNLVRSHITTRVSEDQKATSELSTYESLKQCFLEDLITLNRNRSGTISVSPLFDRSDVPLSDVYVIPDVQVGEFPQPNLSSTDACPQNTPLHSLNTVFEKNGQRYREIYVTSKAGLGKTTFCQRLTLIWCLAHQRENFDTEAYPYVSQEDICVMKDFDFLFLVTLRDVSSKDCELDAMIQHQVINDLSRARRYTEDFLEELFHNENCLIIVDGLDEWIHPENSVPECSKKQDDVPHKKIRKNCTTVTTSRPWKFRKIKLKTCQIDQYLEITGLSDQAANELIRKAIKQLDAKCVSDAAVEAFQTIINERSIQDLKSDPLLLMYLTVLWCGDRKRFGTSRCDIYSNLIDLLLERAETRNKHFDVLTSGKHEELPQCLSRFPHCRKYSRFLMSLSKLAYLKFFAKTREQSLVFGLSTPEIESILTQVEAMFAKEAGFLIASKYTQRESKYSFYHKTMQEFFVALYLQNSPDFQLVLETLDSVDRVVSNRKVMVFLCGLSPEVASDLSKTLCKKVSGFQTINKYRSDTGSWNYFIEYNRLMKSYQEMYIACHKEYKDTFQFGNQTKALFLYLEDIFLDGDHITESLNFLIEVNSPRIKSLKIRDVRTEKSFQQKIELFKQHKVRTLAKLDLKCQIQEKELCDMLDLTRYSLTCFVIKGGQWKDENWTHERVVFSNQFFGSIKDLLHLSEVYLRTLKVTHHQLTDVVRFLSGRESLTQIGLNFITCEDHSDNCPGEKLDLTRHQRLKMLELGDVSLSDVDICTEALEVCYVGKFPKSTTLPKLLEKLILAKNLRVVVCGFLEEVDEINAMLETLIKLHQIQNIWLIGMNLGDHTISIQSETVRLSQLIMIKVKLSAQSFKAAVKIASDARQVVHVGLIDSVVESKEEFDDIKTHKDFLNKCEVIADNYKNEEQNEFLFKTRKECCPLICETP